MKTYFGIAPRVALAGLLGAVCTCITAAPALANTTSTSQCSDPALTQPFAGYGDSNNYALPPGETNDNLDGGGWTLMGGAQIVSSRLADGKTGQVLNLPSGAIATSPTVCVNTTYPMARTLARNIARDGDVLFSVSYDNGLFWGMPQITSQLGNVGSSWTLSNTLNIEPRNVSGWQLARFTFMAIGMGSDTQLYNFYLDPYSKAMVSAAAAQQMAAAAAAAAASAG